MAEPDPFSTDTIGQFESMFGDPGLEAALGGFAEADPFSDANLGDPFEFAMQQSLEDALSSPAGTGMENGLLGHEDIDAASIRERLLLGQEQLFNQLFAGQSPLQQQLFGESGQLTDFLTSGALPSALQVDVPSAAARDTLEAQFANVERQLSESLPRGGQLRSQLADVARGRALSIGQLVRQEALREQALRQQLFRQTLAALLSNQQQAGQLAVSGAANRGAKTGGGGGGTSLGQDIGSALGAVATIGGLFFGG